MPHVKYQSSVTFSSQEENVLIFENVTLFAPCGAPWTILTLSTQRCFTPNLVKIGLVILEKK